MAAAEMPAWRGVRTSEPIRGRLDLELIDLSDAVRPATRHMPAAPTAAVCGHRMRLEGATQAKQGKRPAYNPSEHLGVDGCFRVIREVGMTEEFHVAAVSKPCECHGVGPATVLSSTLAILLE